MSLDDELPGATPDEDMGDPVPPRPGTPAGEDRPLGDRVGRDPSNLGDDIPSEGDVTYPPPVREGGQM